MAEELARDPNAELEESFVSHHVLRRLCKLTDAKMTDGDRGCLKLAQLCCRIAGKLETDEAFARSFACLGSALRAANRLQHAERALQLGLAVATSRLVGDLHRRLSYLRLYERRFAEALHEAEAALEMGSGLDHARALAAVGAVNYYSGRNARAIRAYQRSLEQTSPDDTAEYENVFQNYTTALAKGTDEEAAQALDLCDELHSRLKDRHKMQRAKLWWTRGLLHKRLGNPSKAWQALDIARRSLVALEAAPEVAAIVANMAEVSPEPLAVRLICGDAAGVVEARQSLIEPLRALATAAREMIPEAAAALAKAANQLAPCPAL